MATATAIAAEIARNLTVSSFEALARVAPPLLAASHTVFNSLTAFMAVAAVFIVLNATVALAIPAASARIRVRCSEIHFAAVFAAGMMVPVM